MIFFIRSGALIALFLFLSASSFAVGSTPVEQCEELLKSKDYSKCFKKSTAFYSSTKEDIFLLYKSVTLVKLVRDKKILKKYPDPIGEVCSSLKLIDPESLPNQELKNLGRRTSSLFKKMQDLYLDKLEENKTEEGIDLFKTLVFLYDGTKSYLKRPEEFDPYSSLDKMRDLVPFEKREKLLDIKFFLSDFNEKHPTEGWIDRSSKWKFLEAQNELYYKAYKAYSKGDIAAATALIETLCNTYTNKSKARENYYLTHILDSMPNLKSDAFNGNRLFEIPNAELDRIKKILPVSNFTNKQLKVCHTAYYESYITELEKDVVLIHNLARWYPQKFKDDFCSDYYKKYNIKTSKYSTSLLSDLAELKPRIVLYTSIPMFELAKEHAKEMGEAGKTGHASLNGDRSSDRAKRHLKSSGVAENCSYGRHTAYQIVMQLLIDENVESMGHRRNLLNASYEQIGASFWKHKKYKSSMVLNYF